MDTELETKIYKELSDHLNKILQEHGPNEKPLEKKWRGLIAINCFKGFLDTALTSEQNNPHEIMSILDHMFVQLVDLYQNGPVLNPDQANSETPETDQVCSTSD